jgi:hypothetical protein
MSAERKVRGTARPPDPIKVAIAILALLLGCILVLWIITRMLHREESQPEVLPRSEKSK